MEDGGGVVDRRIDDAVIVFRVAARRDQFRFVFHTRLSLWIRGVRRGWVKMRTMMPFPPPSRQLLNGDAPQCSLISLCSLIRGGIFIEKYQHFGIWCRCGDVRLGRLCRGFG